jgi:Predicted integral membrane protein
MSNIAIAPRAFTRADIVEPTRLQGFSDAVFATAATLLIVPVRKIEIRDNESLKDALIGHYPQFLVFIFGYLVICTIWESHLVRYKVINKVDDFLVALNLFSLMITTFLPFTVALVGHFGHYQASALMNSSALLALELCELALFIYGFSNPRLLSDSFNELEPIEKKLKKKQIYFKIFINCTLFSLSAIFSVFSYILSNVIICAVLATPFMKRFVARITTRAARRRNPNISSNFEVLTGRIDKERIECFSDAAIAIVATLLILDLTAEDFPTKQEVEENGLAQTLRGMLQMFISYIGTYVTIAFLWFIHHAVLHYIRVFTPLLIAANRSFLALVAFTPFLATLTNKYSGHATDNARVAVGFSSLVLFFASFTNVVLLVFALFQADVTLYDWAQPRNEGNPGLIYLTLKTLIIPVISFITFIVSLFGNSETYWAFHVNIILGPVLFLVLKLFYACHWRQHQTPPASPLQSRENSQENVNMERTESPNGNAAVI